jgi:inward rectifier potassium channel
MTLMHVIDQESPMFEMNAKKCTLLRPEIFVTMVGTDGTFGQTIHATHTYQYSDIQWGKSFKDMVTVMPDGSREIDYANFHHTL